MVSESEENETFRFFPLRFRRIDNSDYESGPNFYFQQVLNDVTTPLTTQTPTRRR